MKHFKQYYNIFNTYKDYYNKRNKHFVSWHNFSDHLTYYCENVAKFEKHKKQTSMKKLFALSVLVLTMVFTSSATAQKFPGLDKSPADIASQPSTYKISKKNIRVVYSRPQLKGRLVKDLAPAGKVWRTGANEAAEITFYADTQFGSKTVKAGTYSLFSIPGDKEWTVILNKNLNQWGAYSYEKDADAVRITAKVSKSKDAIEAFSITFTDTDMVMGWGTTLVSVPFKVSE